MTSRPALGSHPSASPTVTAPPTVGDDSFAQVCARTLKSPVIVTDIGDGALLVEPLHFHRVCRFRGQAFVSKSYHGGHNA